jgi:catechol 2,3-dioxygenase-like lactoylglutathione lyase family enzyme
MKFEKPSQIAIVVKDVEKSTKFLQENFGIGPFALFEIDDGEAIYKGSETKFKSKVGVAGLGGVMFEIIEMVEGDTITSDPEYLPPGGQGVHHIGFIVENAEALAKEWEAEGSKVLQRSWPKPGSQTIYLDTPRFAGVLVELIQLGGAEREK